MLEHKTCERILNINRKRNTYARNKTGPIQKEMCQSKSKAILATSSTEQQNDDTHGMGTLKHEPMRSIKKGRKKSRMHALHYKHHAHIQAKYANKANVSNKTQCYIKVGNGEHLKHPKQNLTHSAIAACLIGPAYTSWGSRSYRYLPDHLTEDQTPILVLLIC